MDDSFALDERKHKYTKRLWQDGCCLEEARTFAGQLVELNKYKILETGRDVLILDQYARHHDYYGPSQNRKFSVIGEENSQMGQILIRETGEEGYHVPLADRTSHLRFKGRYLSPSYPETVVRVHHKFRVPRRIEELICVKTGRNAVSPLVQREKPQKKVSIIRHISLRSLLGNRDAVIFMMEFVYGGWDM